CKTVTGEQHLRFFPWSKYGKVNTVRQNHALVLTQSRPAQESAPRDCAYRDKIVYLGNTRVYNRIPQWFPGINAMNDQIELTTTDGPRRQSSRQKINMAAKNDCSSTISFQSVRRGQGGGHEMRFAA